MEREIKSNHLRMTFDPNTIQHLGIKMYSHLPAAIAELVANAYDADATIVQVRLYDDDRDKSIVVADDGHGMSFDEVNDYFLKIGRNRRSEQLKKTPGGRTASGKKGLGKLALFGIGERIDVNTRKAGVTEGTKFTLIWEELKNWDRNKCPDYQPSSKVFSKDKVEHGTEIKILDLKRKTPFALGDLSISLSRLFNFLGKDFRVFLSLNDRENVEVTNELKYSSFEEQFSWIFPEASSRIKDEDEMKSAISGKVITTKVPLPPGQRGITLFANGRMVNEAEFFGFVESSNFYSYATGWLNVDFIDEDEGGEDDNIATNRKQLTWENERPARLREYLRKIITLVQKEWRLQRNQENIEKAQASTGIVRKKWLSTIPEEKAAIIDKTIDQISDPDFKKNYTEVVERAFYAIAPEYAALHWRFLHKEIHNIAKEPHHRKEYFEAVREAALLYVQRVRDMSGIDSEEMQTIFNPGNGKLMITDCLNETERNIQNGHQYLSQGVVAGCRNVVTHNPEFEKHLVETGLYDEKVCLDMLALISHLFTRLEKAKERPASPSGG